MTKHPRSDPSAAVLLLVEDDPKIASFIQKSLRREGFRVEWVSTGTAGDARLLEGGVDALILDLGLPDLDGLELLRRMRDRGSDLPVVVVTGRTDPKDQTTAVSLGVRAYLTKPFAMTALLRELRAAVEGAGSPLSGRPFSDGG